tara:strand:+ start:171 stop:629 length:459 start_codon:yes stop_codon:yes gene_type:complete
MSFSFVNSQIRERSKKFSKKFDFIVNVDNLKVNTVTVLSDDKLGLKEEIYYNLSTVGIKSLSTSIANEKITNVSYDANTANLIEATDYKADIGVELSYTFNGFGIYRFNGTIVNLDNGENIGTMRWRGREREPRLIGEVIAYLIIEKFINNN